MVESRSAGNYLIMAYSFFYTVMSVSIKSVFGQQAPIAHFFFPYLAKAHLKLSIVTMQLVHFVALSIAF